MDVVELVIGLLIMVAGFFVALLGGSLVLGIFQSVRDANLSVAKSQRRMVLSPLMEIFKQNVKTRSGSTTNSKITRGLILFAWTVSTFTAALLVPVGTFSIVPNVFGDFQLFGVFGLLMVYPVGLMLLCFLSSRKSAIYNLKFLSEDFFSSFITFLLTTLSITIIYNASFDLVQLPTIQSLVSYQLYFTIPAPGLDLPALFGFLNPLALVAFFASLPIVFDPLKLTDSGVSQKWTPLHDFSGRQLGLVRIIEVLRFYTMIMLFIDVFLGGASFWNNMLLDFLTIFLASILLALILASVKTRRKSWLLDKKIIGFFRVHNIIAFIALCTVLVLAMF